MAKASNSKVSSRATRAEREVEALTRKAAQLAKLTVEIDSYYRSIMCSQQELQAQARWYDRYDTHLHNYVLRHGHGVFYYECVCGANTGQVLWPETRSAI